MTDEEKQQMGEALAQVFEAWIRLTAPTLNRFLAPVLARRFAKLYMEHKLSEDLAEGQRLGAVHPSNDASTVPPPW